MKQQAILPLSNKVIRVGDRMIWARRLVTIKSISNRGRVTLKLKPREGWKTEINISLLEIDWSKGNFTGSIR